MKNRTTYIAIFAVILIPFVGPWEGASLIPATTPTEGIRFEAVSKDTANFMPVLDLEFADLDVRDAQNRPVNDAAATAELKALFLTGLYNLAAVSPGHAIEQMWADIQLFSRLFKDAFFTSVAIISRAKACALAPPTKPVVHNVYNLWIDFSVAGFLLLTLFQFSLAKIPSSRRILRC